ncbi:hypothetical protein [Caballeronia sordidicola]|uniref:Uncharacterized protein n=1 Tax=Caballeronia sordidicola TaxID=196367 RepID=A0A226X6L6_CABSO|nr:hypothetical protein [Caballeronia sordidicola]OXC78650.1 hypothetical protein BSU04_11000 [Caballeronia sordidicola]
MISKNVNASPSSDDDVRFQVSLRIDNHPGRYRDDAYNSVRAENPAQQFWLDVVRASGSHGPKVEGDASSLVRWGERKLKDEFPESLFEKIRDRVSRGDSNSRDLLFAFKIRRIDYGSLLFSVDVVGIKNIAELFEKNFDVFVLVTSAYVRSAFGTTFNVVEDMIEVDPIDFCEVKSAFEHNGETPSTESPDPIRLAHLKYVWNVVQGTLILPLLLALLVCFVWMNAWYHERDVQKSEREELTKERGALLELSKTQITSLVQQNTDLSRSIAQNAASEVLALTQANAALAKSLAEANCCCNGCCENMSDPKPKPENHHKPLPHCKGGR